MISSLTFNRLCQIIHILHGHTISSTQFNIQTTYTKKMTAFYGQNPAGRALENSLFLLLNLIVFISIFYWTISEFGVIF
jgi:hypothetical protein